MKAALRILVFCWLVMASHAEDAVRAVNQFGLACLKLTPDNSLLSPWSLEQSLGLAYAGARGQTQAEMAAVLGMPGNMTDPAGAFQRLRKSMLEAGGAGNQTLQSANCVFVSSALPLRPEWKEMANGSFAAEIEALDFSNLKAVKESINDRVKTQTGGKISEVLPVDLPVNTMLVLVNALNFDTPWDERFTKELTHDSEFFTERGKSKTVSLMFKQHQLRYARKKGFQIAALPYAGGRFQFVVILPDAVDGLAAVEARLTPELLVACATLPVTEVRLSFPRFKMDPPASSMKQLLIHLGMRRAFDGADFSGISATPLEISEVFHRTFMETDEDGTKAAAASATVLRYKNGFPHEVPHEVVKADHPFIFLVQDVQSGVCLFIGRLADPLPETPARASASGLQPEPKK